MRQRVGDVVVATVTIVAMVGGAVIAVLVFGQGRRAPDIVAVPAATSPPPGGASAAHGGASATPTPSSSASPSPSSSAGSSTSSGRSSTSPTDSPSVCVARHQQTNLSVVTFNIHSARAQNGSVHLGEIARALAVWHPDVVLLQEVDRGRLWTGRIDMPSLLGARLRMNPTFGDNVRRSATNQYGTAILSRYPILNSRNVLLPAPPGTQQRGLLHATIDVNGILVSVYGTHLENTSRVARLKQIRAIAPILAADPRPEIFGGDLNATPTSRVVVGARSVVRDTWTSVGTGAGWTHPAQNPRMRIDYLFYRSGSGVSVDPLHAQVLPPVVSDHRAVGANYRLAAGHGNVCLPVLTRVTRR